MATQDFQSLLKSIRESSRWPELPDFAAQVGLSLGGLRKYESGERIPSPTRLEDIIQRARIAEGPAGRLRVLRDEDKMSQVELSTGPGTAVGSTADAEKLRTRLVSEVVYVLKQAGVRLPPRTQKVLEKRVSLILNAALED